MGGDGDAPVCFGGNGDVVCGTAVPEVSDGYVGETGRVVVITGESFRHDGFHGAGDGQLSLHQRFAAGIEPEGHRQTGTDGDGHQSQKRDGHQNLD